MFFAWLHANQAFHYGKLMLLSKLCLGESQ